MSLTGAVLYSRVVIEQECLTPSGNIIHKRSYFLFLLQAFVKLWEYIKTENWR